jgi:acetyl esterase/lipase
VRRPLLAVAACALVVSTLAGCSARSASSVPVGTGTVPTLTAGEKVTVTYCNHEQAKITEPPSIKNPAPAVVYVHGGSWVSGDYDTGGFIVKAISPALASKGFVVVSVDYRLGPTDPWPSQIEDVKCAIRYLRANAQALNVNPTEIGAWGHSAGGHLVGLLGTAGPSAGWDIGAYTNESSKVEAVVDMAGPSDLLTMGDQGDSGIVQDSFISLLGPVAPDQLGPDLKAASPVTYIKHGDPPFLLFHSDNDQIVYPQQSQEFAWDLAVNHVPYELVNVHGAGHEFDQAGGSPDPAQITAQIVDFFIEHLAFHR